jgi:hypothetical protein
MTEINREQFEAWLFSQPDERLFIYTEGGETDKTGCLVCNFLREQTGLNGFNVSVCWVSYGPTLTDRMHFQEWLMNLLQRRSPSPFSAKETKLNYVSMFGDPSFSPELKLSENRAEQHAATSPEASGSHFSKVG